MKKFEIYKESSEFLKNKLNGFIPEVLLILGSGISFLSELVEDSFTVDYSEIPHLRKSTVNGHKGRFIFGKLSGKNVAVMDGRLHVYEGYSPDDVAFPVYIMNMIGAKNLVVTNAVGAINTEYNVGDLMLILDHIKLVGLTPLQGEEVKEFGPRFFDMTYAYSREHAETVRNIAKNEGINLREGVYFYAQGSQFETPAEIRAMRILGADAVGMSTVFEVIAAAHCKMKTLGISLVTNMAAGVIDESLDHFECETASSIAKDGFSKIILGALKEM